MKKLILISIFLIFLVFFLSFNFLMNTIKEKATIFTEKISDQVIVDGAKFKAKLITTPVKNVETPFQLTIVNGVTPPDPQICVLNVSINGETVLSNKSCINENETLNLTFDYKVKENETTWNISIFYSVESIVKNVSLFLKKRPAEEGSKINLIIILPEKVKKGDILRGSATFTSDLDNWIKVEKVVLIIKKENTYYKFEKILDYSIPPKFHYTTDYETALPENIQTGNYTVRGILFYFENNVEKAIGYSRNIEII